MTMVIKVSGILGIIFALSTLLSEVSGHDTVVAHFHMEKKNPELKECAADILQENECIAVRRSQLTGQCESLPHSWGKDEIMESGYDYAKKIFVQETFQPPPEVVPGKPMYWKIPGVFKTGAKLDAFMTFPTGFPGPIIVLTSLLGEVSSVWSKDHSFGLTFQEDKLQAFKGGFENSKYVDNWYVKAGSKQEVKMSWLARNDSVAVYANDVELLTYRLNVRFDVMKQIYFFGDHGLPPIKLSRLQFSA